MSTPGSSIAHRYEEALARFERRRARYSSAAAKSEGNAASFLLPIRGHERSGQSVGTRETGQVELSETPSRDGYEISKSSPLDTPKEAVERNASYGKRNLERKEEAVTGSPSDISLTNVDGDQLGAMDLSIEKSKGFNTGLGNGGISEVHGTSAFLGPLQIDGEKGFMQRIKKTLDPLIAEHRRLFTLITEGVMIQVVRTSSETEESSAASSKLLYVTSDLRNIVWEDKSRRDTYCVPLCELTGIICFQASYISEKLEPTSPVMRVMVRGSTSHWDCVFSHESDRKDWIAGIALAHGLTTVETDD